MAVHVAAPVAAGLASGIVFIALFSGWAANPPIYRVESWVIHKVVIPQDASTSDAAFEPKVIDAKAGDVVAWTSRTAVVNLVIEPKCVPLSGYNATVTSFGTEKLMMSDNSFECRFVEAGEYRVHTEPYPWMQGTIRVAP